MKTNQITDGLLGLTIGDAIGVPFEFKSRNEMIKNPAKDMIGFGTHQQPEGTWSDDSSLTLCLAESLIEGFKLRDIANSFVKWKYQSYWTARGNVFDIGRTTSRAITRLKDILERKDYKHLTELKYESEEYDNGNGSLMRILPLICVTKGKQIDEQFEIIWNVSALTHRHIRAAMCCLIYLRIIEKLLNKKDKQTSYDETKLEIQEFWKSMEFAEREKIHFSRLIQNDIRDLKYEELKSGGYVIESIEASIWCFLKSANFEESILKSVNLGHDTDTTACITGGLSGIYYTMENVPTYWIASIARMEDIIEVGNKLNKKYWLN